MLGDFEANVLDLFRLLYDRIRGEVATRHVAHGDRGWQITDARRLAGRIVWDPDRGGEVLLLVVDGRAFTWDEVGRTLMSFEGFTLKASVEDTIEVVGGPLMNIVTMAEPRSVNVAGSGTGAATSTYVPNP